MPLHRRKRGTGTITFREEMWIAMAPQTGGRGNASQRRVATKKTRREAELALDVWLKSVAGATDGPT
jgi:hypothetical protein